MKNKYCLDEKSQKKVQAALLLAERLGLIEDASEAALEKRREEKNEENRQAEKAGKLFYGPRFYTPAMYLQYELTRFKLDFVQPSEQVRKLGVCPSFSEEEKREFYEKNQDLFGRYHGDLFSYEEVAIIIEKRLREEAYEKLVHDVLCQLRDGE